MFENQIHVRTKAIFEYFRLPARGPDGRKISPIPLKKDGKAMSG